MRGRTRLSRLLRDGKELKVFPIQAGDLAEFKRQAKHYGVLFSAIKDKSSEGELIDVLAARRMCPSSIAFLSAWAIQRRKGGW